MWVSSRLLVYDKIKLNEFYLLKRFNLNKTLSKSSISTTTKINTENEVRENKEENKLEENVVDGFRVFEPFKKTAHVGRKVKRGAALQIGLKYVRPDRYRTMPVFQDWTNTWPTNSIFKQSATPLPVYQGFVKNLSENNGIPPGKYGNAELMKIPNFMHLTPPHIKKHCNAIKKFCTEWPKELKTDQDCVKYFPIEIQTTDYVYAGPSIRDERSRIVTLKISLSSLILDVKSRDKLIKLADERYDSKTDILTITSGRCPYRKQNYDYVKYLLDVLFNESWKTESWESDSNMSEEDWSRYIWDKSQSKKNIYNLVEKIGKTVESDDVKNAVDKYSKSVSKIFDSGESKENINEYKQSVLKLLNIESEGSKSAKNKI